MLEPDLSSFDYRARAADAAMGPAGQQSTRSRKTRRRRGAGSRPGDLESRASDVCLMLRADTEMRCLSREVIPVMREIESSAGMLAAERGAALAYLEASWLEAQRRAVATDSAYERLTAALGVGDCERDEVYGHACRYRTAVLRLREVVARRIAPLLATSAPAAAQAAAGGR